VAVFEEEKRPTPEKPRNFRVPPSRFLPIPGRECRIFLHFSAQRKSVIEQIADFMMFAVSGTFDAWCHGIEADRW
jgi:hypothetical protein